MGTLTTLDIKNVADAFAESRVELAPAGGRR
jgi:hypothetical protein